MTAINGQEQQYKKPGIGACIGGALVGGMASNAIKVPVQLLSPKIAEKMGKISNGLTDDEFKLVQRAIDETMETSGLSKKGVEIVKATAENSDKVAEILSKELDGHPIIKRLPKQARDFVTNMYSSMVKNGKNAFYAPHSKKIVLPEGKKLALAAFHEAGHAVNHNVSKIGKILQKFRPLQILAIPIGLIALWKTKKAPGQEPTGAVDKTTNFVKENAGKLTFAAFLPTLIEEGMATLRGNKFAKSLSSVGNAIISPETAKKVAKTNALGFSTYLGMAALSSLGIFVGAKIKDSIAKNKPIEKA